MDKIKDNEFRLEMTGLRDFAFDVLGYYLIGEWGGVTCDTDNTGATILVKATRRNKNNSPDTAKWFREAIEPGSAIGDATLSSLPAELHFAFKGTMSFTHLEKRYEGFDIVIAQGHNLTLRNNWWMGGPHMSVAAALHIAGSVATQPFGHKVKDKFLPTAEVMFIATNLNVSSMRMGIVPLPV